MSFTPGFNGVFSNGTTPVTLVSAPGERTQRIIKKMLFHNTDTASVVVTVKHVRSGGSSFLLMEKTIVADADEVLENIVLDATTDTITVELGGAVSTTEISATAHYADLGP